jgi:hypothetical protein
MSGRGEKAALRNGLRPPIRPRIQRLSALRIAKPAPAFAERAGVLQSGRR